MIPTMHSEDKDMAAEIRSGFDDQVAMLRLTQDRCSAAIAHAAAMIIAALQADGGVLLFGNGGSAADAQHIAAELVGRFLRERRPLRAIALTTDTSTLTSVANDYDYRMVFARQLAGLGRPGDVAVGLSTSGNSPNVLAGLHEARRIGMKTIAFTGAGGGKCAALADVLLDVPSQLSPRIQECHATMYHVICALVEKAFAGQQWQGPGVSA